MKNEDGINSGTRNLGRFALSGIPIALGLAASVWLGVFIEAHGYLDFMSQEQRRAIYVGAEHRPKDPIKISSVDDYCVKIDRIDLEGSMASVYFTNHCGSKQSFIAVHWQSSSPNGIAIAGGYHYSSMLGGPDSLLPKEKGESVLQDVSVDDRIASVRFWMSGQ